MNDDHAEIQGLLDDFVDGYLNADDTRRVETHLSRCETCREEVAGLRALIEDSRDLPRELPPSRDLWPDIASRIGSDGGAGAAGSNVVPLFRRPAFWLPVFGGLAAAAALVVALIAVPDREPGAGTAAVVDTLSGTTPAGTGGEARWPAMHRALEAECLSTGRLVMAAWQSRDAEMDPALGRDIDQGLNTLNASISETVEALEQDPDNPGLMDMLSDLYGKKLHLLKKTLRLAGVA